jgi:hypothetical protein
MTPSLTTIARANSVSLVVPNLNSRVLFVGEDGLNDFIDGVIDVCTHRMASMRNKGGNKGTCMFWINNAKAYMWQVVKEKKVCFCLYLLFILIDHLDPQLSWNLVRLPYNKTRILESGVR